MFDISFTELMLIGVVALVVIGPERLPRVARTVGHLLGRAQRYVGDVKSDIQREMEVDELKDLKGQMEDAAKSVKASMKETTDSLRDPLEDARKALRETTESVESLAKATQGQLNDLSDTATGAKTTDSVDSTGPDDSADSTDPTGAAQKTQPTATAPMPERPLSDTERADLRLAQAAPPSDAQPTNTSDHDAKSGTPL